MFTQNPNISAPLSASANASRTANSINHTPPQISTRNSGARTAAYIGGGVAAGVAATAYAMSGAAAQAPTANSSAPISAPTSITAPAVETAAPKMASIKEKESILHFADQDIDFTLRQMKNSDGSTDIILDMPANYADDNNMAARYEYAKDSVIKSILTNPDLKSYRDEIAKSGKMLIGTGRETNIIVPMTINISDSREKIETVAEANFANPAMVAMAHATVKNKFGGDYYKNFNMNDKA
jgi:aspartate 1-decarboxylase